MELRDTLIGILSLAALILWAKTGMLEKRMAGAEYRNGLLTYWLSVMSQRVAEVARPAENCETQFAQSVPDADFAEFAAPDPSQWCIECHEKCYQETGERCWKHKDYEAGQAGEMAET